MAACAMQAAIKPVPFLPPPQAFYGTHHASLSGTANAIYRHIARKQKILSFEDSGRLGHPGG
jgi:hypothetical protein